MSDMTTWTDGQLAYYAATAKAAADKNIVDNAAYREARDAADAATAELGRRGRK